MIIIAQVINIKDKRSAKTVSRISLRQTATIGEMGDVLNRLLNPTISTDNQGIMR
jgi:hypothetical protein